jgi:hypothetical protein
MTVEQWLATREEEGLEIDPSTAEVFWIYAQTLDPYGWKQHKSRLAFPAGFGDDSIREVVEAVRSGNRQLAR